MDYRNSYEDYRGILRRLNASGKVYSFSEATEREMFVVLRHDVEFSVRKAEEMARLDAEAGVPSAFFFQIGNESYNALSDESIAAITRMHDMGREIGLHYRQRGSSDESELVARDLSILEDALGFPCRLFSTHRPNRLSPYERYAVPGAINAYGPIFFTKTDNPADVAVRYISDSCYRWNYGNPAEFDFESAPRVQLLIHPFQWWPARADLAECFGRLEGAHMETLRTTYRREYKRHPSNEI